MRNNRVLGLFLGIMIAITIYLLPIKGLSIQGKVCFALTMMTVVFWVFQVVQPGFSSGLYLALLIIFKVAEPSLVFSPWLGSTMYLVIGAYLIAAIVRDSGLGERIAYKFILKFVNSFKSIIISIFMLTFVLSIIIPHPWPRAFLIMSVMKVIIDSANIPNDDAVKIGFTVFAASVPISMIFFTGDSVINPLAAQASGINIGWIKWFIYMGPPSIISSVVTCILILILFKPINKIQINKEEIKGKLQALGSLSKREKRTIAWLFISVVLWLSDSIHGVNIGWITLLISMMMSFPVIGEVLEPRHWEEIPVHVLLFLNAAMAIGTIGNITGMNSWIAQTVLPSSMPTNIYFLAMIIGMISIGIHMILGSVIAVMGIAIPALLIFTEFMNINPIVITLFVYTSIGMHYILPFHHLNILVGQGEKNGMYNQKEVMRLGIPLTFVVFIILLVEVLYWKLLGLI